MSKLRLGRKLQEVHHLKHLGNFTSDQLHPHADRPSSPSPSLPAQGPSPSATPSRQPHCLEAGNKNSQIHLAPTNTTSNDTLYNKLFGKLLLSACRFFLGLN
ncbi:hypothetical protein E2C01_075550 [Portunus trituberculatus]|uniref:Uncharacterized protein n=1 Tax=Portunus trituberculatus TaxID=210409 RepID=A0A5B7IAZ3_PORTR|nr:hypothetical protein [Portunus trituberculatus]